MVRLLVGIHAVADLEKASGLDGGDLRGGRRTLLQPAGQKGLSRADISDQ